MFTSVKDVDSRPERGQSSTTSRPLLNALYHSYACVFDKVDKPSVTFSAITHTKFHLQCKIWDKFFVRYSYPLKKSRNTLDNIEHYEQTKWQIALELHVSIEDSGPTLASKRFLDNLFKRDFWMINSRYFFNRMYTNVILLYGLVRQKWAFSLPEKISTFKTAIFEILAQINSVTIENTRKF